MSRIVFIISLFVIGFCFGALYESKHTLEVLEKMKNQNKEWALLCKKQNENWVKYCESLIEEINVLKGGKK